MPAPPIRVPCCVAQRLFQRAVMAIDGGIAHARFQLRLGDDGACAPQQGTRIGGAGIDGEYVHGQVRSVGQDKNE